MRRFLRKILLKPVLWASAKFSSRPEKKLIFPALDKLYQNIKENPGKRGLLIPVNTSIDKFIIFSDQHKGGRDGADDFAGCEPNYIAALEYYDKSNYSFICLGDSEELWENSLNKVKKMNTKSFDAERLYLKGNRFYKIFGNHDLYWDNDPLASWELKSLFNESIHIYEGMILSVELSKGCLEIFCTHGHQGDAQSDGNWFSKFFVARIWAPLQAYLRINPNTPAFNNEKKTLHNDIMYEWSSTREKKLLITGHTHQPVFGSLTYLERLYRNYQMAESVKDDEKLKMIREDIYKVEKEFTSVSVDYMGVAGTYFNSGCCCFSDGDITGIEIAEGKIRLVKWTEKDERPERVVLEEEELEVLLK